MAVHKGEVGQPFRFEWVQADGVTPYNLTGNSLLEIVFVKTNGARIVKPAVLVGAATLGVTQYVGEVGFLDRSGTWRYQGHFRIGTAPVTDEKYSDIYTLAVGGVL